MKTVRGKQGFEAHPLLRQTRWRIVNKDGETGATTEGGIKAAVSDQSKPRGGPKSVCKCGGLMLDVGFAIHL